MSGGTRPIRQAARAGRGRGAGLAPGQAGRGGTRGRGTIPVGTERYAQYPVQYRYSTVGTVCRNQLKIKEKFILIHSDFIIGELTGKTPGEPGHTRDHARDKVTETSDQATDDEMSNSSVV